MREDKMNLLQLQGSIRVLFTFGTGQLCFHGKTSHSIDEEWCNNIQSNCKS